MGPVCERTVMPPLETNYSATADTKAGKTPYSNIPIFDDVGIIGIKIKRE